MNFLFRLTTSYSNCKILYFEERMKTIGMESGIQHSESGIQGVESGNRDSLGFLYMGRRIASGMEEYQRRQREFLDGLRG